MSKVITCIFMLWLLLASFNCFAETPYQEQQLGYGGWALSWFADDFGDPDYNHPYIITELTASQGKYSQRYFEICLGEIGVGPAFIITIGTRGSGGANKIRMYDQGIIKIKSANGNISTITAPTHNGAIILTEENLLRFADLINNGNFHLALTFHSYLDIGGEPVTWTYNCSHETKDVKKAVLDVLSN